LRITWNPGPVVGQSDVDIRSRLRSAAPPFLLPPLGTLTVDGQFDFAFINHAPMEVMGAVADVRADRAEIWMRRRARSRPSPASPGARPAAERGHPAPDPRWWLVRPRLFFDAGPRPH